MEDCIQESGEENKTQKKVFETHDQRRGSLNNPKFAHPPIQGGSSGAGVGEEDEKDVSKTDGKLDKQSRFPLFVSCYEEEGSEVEDDNKAFEAGVLRRNPRMTLLENSLVPILTHYPLSSTRSISLSSSLLSSSSSSSFLFLSSVSSSSSSSSALSSSSSSPCVNHPSPPATSAKSSARAFKKKSVRPSLMWVHIFVFCFLSHTALSSASSSSSSSEASGDHYIQRGRLFGGDVHLAAEEKAGHDDQQPQKQPASFDSFFGHNFENAPQNDHSLDDVDDNARIDDDEKPRNYSGYKLFHVMPKSKADLFQLHTFIEESAELNQIDVWKGPTDVYKPVDILVSPNFQPAFRTFLAAHFLTYTIGIQNLQDEIDREKADDVEAEEVPDGEDEDLLGSWGRRVLRDSVKHFSFRKYHKFSEIRKYMEDLAEKNQHVLRLTTIGRGHEKRPLIVAQVASSVGDVNRKPSIWIDGGIHAREWISPATVLYFIHRLVTDYDRDQKIKKLVDSVNWYFLPVMNPDGYEYSHEKVSVAKKATRALKRVSGTNYNIGTAADTLYEAAGGSDDWAKGRAGIRFVYLVELRPCEDCAAGFILPRNQILPTARETFDAMKVVAKEVLKRFEPPKCKEVWQCKLWTKQLRGGCTSKLVRRRCQRTCNVCKED